MGQLVVAILFMGLVETACPGGPGAKVWEQKDCQESASAGEVDEQQYTLRKLGPILATVAVQ